MNAQSADGALSVGLSGAFNAFELDDNKVVLRRKKNEMTPHIIQGKMIY